MTRQNIFEILKSKYNVEKEIAKIINLCNSDCFKGNYQYSTVEGVFDHFLLTEWLQRGAYLSCKEMLKDIKEYIVEFNIPDNEAYLLKLEYYANILQLIDINLNFIYSKTPIRATNAFWLAIKNLDYLLEKLNYEKLIIPEEEKVLLVPKKPEAAAVAEISSEDTALAILMYNHGSLKGDVTEKRKLLYQISLEYETLLKNPIEGYNDFFNKTNQLLNNLHIRHDNKTENGNKNLVIDISDKELENWYDELYQLLLFCVLIHDNIKRKNKVTDFLKNLKEIKCKD